MRGVNVHGILASEKILVFLTQKKTEDFTRRKTHPPHLCVFFVSTFLSDWMHINVLIGK